MVLTSSLHSWKLRGWTILLGFFFAYLSIKTVSNFCIVFIFHSLHLCIIFHYMDVGKKLFFLFPYQRTYSKHHNQYLLSHGHSVCLPSFALLFGFGCAGSLLLCTDFLRWLLLLWSMDTRAPGLSSCDSWALE